MTTDRKTRLGPWVLRVSGLAALSYSALAPGANILIGILVVGVLFATARYMKQGPPAEAANEWVRTLAGDRRLEASGPSETGLGAFQRTDSGRPVSVELITSASGGFIRALEPRTVFKTPLSTVGSDVGLFVEVGPSTQPSGDIESGVWEAVAPLRESGVTGTLHVDESVGVLRFETDEVVDPESVHQIMDGVLAVASAVEERVDDDTADAVPEQGQLEASTQRTPN